MSSSSSEIRSPGPAGWSRLVGCPTSSRLRPAGPADAAAVYDLVCVTEIADRGEVESNVEEIAADLVRPATRYWVHEAPSGRIDAAVAVEKVAGEAAIFGSLWVRPGQDDEWLAPLLDMARRQAAELDSTMPLHAFVAASSPAKCARYEAAGGSRGPLLPAAGEGRLRGPAGGRAGARDQHPGRPGRRPCRSPSDLRRAGAGVPRAFRSRSRDLRAVDRRPVLARAARPVTVVAGDGRRRAGGWP